MINFMATPWSRAYLCPLTESRCKELNLDLMVGNNTDPMETAFTISVDLKGNGVTTGISASDRAQTVKALIDPSVKPNDLSRPDHIFPWRPRKAACCAEQDIPRRPSIFDWQVWNLGVNCRNHEWGWHHGAFALTLGSSPKIWLKVGFHWRFGGLPHGTRFLDSRKRFRHRNQVWQV